MDRKPPEQMIIAESESDGDEVEIPAAPTCKAFYRRYNDDEKEKLFFLVYEKGMSVRSAALQLQIKPRTAQYWVRQDLKNPTDQIMRNVASGLPRERPPKLVEEHQAFLVGLIDEKPSLVLWEIMSSLTEKFADLSIQKTALYNFMTEKCRISLKRAHFQAAERNNP
ncbi:hypothetical protein BX666DRAFT_1898543 [Dichotomocladium elegans]|nr:hypothetical protein BX666DRAFT_1898543 [Dichotomocladium elegans]